MATFEVNIFGTSHDDLDSGTGDAKFEFVLHIIEVTADEPITDFDMFIEYYAYPWDVPPNSFGRVISLNGGGITDRFTNNTPQVIHLDTMAPTTSPTLEADCFLNPSGGASCPNPEDIRIFSMAHQVLRDMPAGTGFDTDETDMVNVNTTIASLPVNILIVADGCRYSSGSSAAVNIYKDYGAAGGLYGGSTDTKRIGEDEIIIVN